MAIAVSRFTSSSFGAALDAGGTPLTIGVIPTPDRALRGAVTLVRLLAILGSGAEAEEDE